MIAFGPELFAQKLAVAGGMLPINEAGFEPRHEFAQSLEFRPLAFLRLGLHPVDRLAQKDLQGGSAHSVDVRQDVDGTADRNAPGKLDEAEWTAPAEPDAIDAYLPAT